MPIRSNTFERSLFLYTERCRSGCTSVKFQNAGIPYTSVCGINVFHNQALDSFLKYSDIRVENPSVETNSYVDSVSLTHGQPGERVHIGHSQLVYATMAHMTSLILSRNIFHLMEELS